MKQKEYKRRNIVVCSFFVNVVVVRSLRDFVGFVQQGFMVVGDWSILRGGFEGMSRVGTREQN